MKKTIIAFVAGLCTATVLSASVLTYADSIVKNIEVAVNSITLKVNGKNVNVDNFVYNGTTYVPLRAVSEMLNKKVDWDENTQTADVKDEQSKPSDNTGSSQGKTTEENAEKVPKTVHISEAYMSGDAKIDPFFQKFMPESSFILVSDNWSQTPGNFGLSDIMKSFLQKADINLKLVGEDGSEVKVKMNPSSNFGSKPNSNGHIATWNVKMDSETYKLIKSGVKYKIVPENNSDYKWAIDDNILLVKK